MMCKEDIRAIDDLTYEILGKAKSMTLENLDSDKNGRISDLFIGASEKQLEKRKKNEAYTFYSKNEFHVALYLFFKNQYNAKRIARSCYLLDEDDRFSETLDTGIPLGIVMLPNGGIVTSSIVEVILKVRQFDQRNEFTGMPFDVMAFRLIYEE